MDYNEGRCEVGVPSTAAAAGLNRLICRLTLICRAGFLSTGLQIRTFESVRPAHSVKYSVMLTEIKAMDCPDFLSS